MIQGILSRKAKAGRTGYSQSVYNVKDAAKLLYFLQSNQLEDMAGPEEKVTAMNGEQRSIADRLKPIDRRLKTRNEHLGNAEKYMQYCSVYRKYKQQKPNRQEAFYEAHRMELTHYEAAERYLKEVMNGRTALSMKAWKAERDRLNAERQRLSYQYSSLKDEVKEVEQMRKNISRIMQEESHREHPKKTFDLDR